MSETLSESQRLEIVGLCKAARAMLEAANQLWAANNPEDAAEIDGVKPMSPEEAQEYHSDAFSQLQTAEYYVRKRFHLEEMES